MKHVFPRLFSVLVLILALVGASPSTLTQAASPASPAAGMSPELFQAVLQAPVGAEAFKSGDTLTGAGLTFRFDNGGMQAQSAGLSWNIAFSSFGRGPLLNKLRNLKVVKSANRLEYRRGELTEWYRLTPLGLEQGFTILSAPRGLGKLTLTLDVQTDLHANPSGDESGVVFSTDSDKTLHYDNLTAVDAKGKALKASMSYNDGQVTIQITDRGAAYPITIDPLVYLQYKLIAVDGAPFDDLGISVAFSGDTALVGAFLAQVGTNSSQGAAYIFTRSGTSWIFQQKLTASDGAQNNEFGISVALSGDTALVGASYATVGSNTYQGAAYVFTRSGTAWSQQQKLTAPVDDGAAYDFFGNSVALSGNTALIGASFKKIGSNTYQGAVYAFTRSGATWSQQQKLTAADGAASDYFGYSVALSDNTALVGASYKKIGSNASQGKAYVFTRSGSAWSQVQELTAFDGAASDRFGGSVALSGNTALIGAPGVNSQRGAAYVFARSGSSWGQQQKLTAADGATYDLFGSSVALSGNTALVGAITATVNGNVQQGAAYFFNRIGASWSLQQKLVDSGGASNNRFGSGVALSGDTAIVGAQWALVNGHSQQGAAFTFEAYRTDADLVATTAINVAQTNPGRVVYLSAVVTNMSNNNADYVVAQVSLPAGLTYVAGAPTQGSFDPSTGSWSMGTLLPWTGATLTIEATVDTIPSQTLTFSNSILSLDANNANNTASSSLAVLSPAFSVNPTAWSFGLVNDVGGSSPAKAFTITNTGQAGLVLHSLTKVGPNAASFSLGSDTCSNQTIAPAQSCTFNVIFSPGSLGKLTAYVSMADNAPGTPHSITLDGYGANELSSNGGFNTYPSNSRIPTGWSAVKFSSSDGKDTAYKQEGAASLRITGTSSTTKTLTQTKTVSPSNGGNFLFSVYAKGKSIPSSGLAQAQVLFYNGSNLVQTKTITLPTGTYNFTKKSLSFTGPSGTYTTVKIVLIYSKSTGSVWFDILSLLQAP
jgi:uncharacterized repeat protein (TIGR01451 family)